MAMAWKIYNALPRDAFSYVKNLLGFGKEPRIMLCMAMPKWLKIAFQKNMWDFVVQLYVNIEEKVQQVFTIVDNEWAEPIHCAKFIRAALGTYGPIEFEK